MVGLIAAFMTAFYMFRLIFMTFHGKPRDEEAFAHAHESPRSMTIPLIVLAIPSVLIGLALGLPPEDGHIDHFLEPVFEAAGVAAARLRRPGSSA